MERTRHRAIDDLTDPVAVELAMIEYDDRGRDAFNGRYGFAGARRYHLIHDGKRYDAKSILMAAYGIQHPDRGPLTNTQLASTRRDVHDPLVRLGFEVESAESLSRVSISGLTDAAAVVAAIAEFDRLGREEFLARYEFGSAEDYFIAYDGRLYDSKAIAGRAYGIQHPDRGPLTAEQFSGGAATVERALGRMGFTVVRPGAEKENPSIARAVVANTDDYWFHHFRPTDEVLHVPEVNFWRPQAQSAFRAINPGAPFFFRLKHPDNAVAGFGYFDQFLRLPINEAWERFGAANGDPNFDRFASRIAGYRGAEIESDRPLGCIIVRDAVFLPRAEWIPWGDAEDWSRNIVAYKTYRLGDGPGVQLSQLITATYVGREIARPLSEVERVELASQSDAPSADAVEVELGSLVEITTEAPALTDSVATVMTTTARNARSAAFRVAVRRAYGFRCAVCGLCIQSPQGEPEVQGAHIYPRSHNGSDDPRNGIALCQHHHWCFDRGLFAIADDCSIIVRGNLPETGDYDGIRALSGQLLNRPTDPRFAPHPIFLKARRELMNNE